MSSPDSSESSFTERMILYMIRAPIRHSNTHAWLRLGMAASTLLIQCIIGLSPSRSSGSKMKNKYMPLKLPLFPAPSPSQAQHPGNSWTQSNSGPQNNYHTSPVLARAFGRPRHPCRKGFRNLANPDRPCSVCTPITTSTRQRFTRLSATDESTKHYTNTSACSILIVF
jgi:hypothetical protein